MADEGERVNEITSRFRDAGFELRLTESMPGAWEAIWHRHGHESGLTGETGPGGGIAAGATLLDAAEQALRRLEEG
jgi:hypothetical protein